MNTIPTSYTNEQRKDICADLFKKYKENALPKRDQVIPKIIHQIWLGSELPEAYKQWGVTFRKFHPGWEYKLWTEKEVQDLKMTNREAYEQTKNFGAKSDFLRYEILYQFGGMYADTDFECTGSFEKFHNTTDLYAILLDDTDKPVILAGLFGSIPGHPILKTCIENMSQPINTRDANMQVKLVDGPYFTECFLASYQEGGFANVVLPYTYAYPFPAGERHVKDRAHVFSFVKPETLAIHYWEVSWHPKMNIFQKILQKLLPKPVKEKIKKFIKY